MLRRTVILYIAAVAAGAAGSALAAVAFDTRAFEPATFAAFAVVTLALQYYSLRVPGSGHIVPSGIAAVACAFALGAPYGMALAAAVGVAQWLRSRGLFHRAVFDVAQLVLATGAAALVYAAVPGDAAAARVGAALLAGVAYTAVNITLVCVAIGLSERVSALAVWNERFRVGRFHYLSNGPLALLWAALATAAGPLGIVLFAAAPLLVLRSLRPLVARLRPAPLAAGTSSS